MSNLGGQFGFGFGVGVCLIIIIHKVYNNDRELPVDNNYGRAPKCNTGKTYHLHLTISFLELQGYAVLGMEVNNKLDGKELYGPERYCVLSHVSCKASLLHFYGDYSYGGMVLPLHCGIQTPHSRVQIDPCELTGKFTLISALVFLSSNFLPTSFHVS